MTQSSYPFENVDTTETQFSQFFRNLGAGVVGSPSGTELKVTAGTGLAVSVALGQAMVRGHFYNSTAAEAISLTAANGTNPRIDAIVLTLDPTANSIVLAKVDGTPAGSPVAPTLTQTDAGVYQYLLATVLVPAAATVPSTITDSRGFLGSRFGVWTTATRPATSGGVQAGFNSTTGLAEFWNGSAWSSFLPAAGTITNAMLANSAITVNGSATSLGGSVVLPTNRNAIINGGFDIWQRGTSATVGGYSAADRWRYDNVGGTYTISKQTFTPGSAPVAGYEAEGYYRLNLTAASGYQAIAQRIEDVRTFAGQAVTLSFWAKTGSANSVAVYLDQNFGSGGSTEVSTTLAAAQALTTGWVRYTFTVTVPSVSGKTIGSSSYLQVRISVGTATTYDIWGVQLEAGSVATPFARNGSSLQGELAACQRYYVRFDNAFDLSVIGLGLAATGTVAYITMNLPVQMRVNPTSIDYSLLRLSDGPIPYNATSATLLISGNKTPLINIAVASGLTANRTYFLQLQTAAGYLGLSAEL